MASIFANRVTVTNTIKPSSTLPVMFGFYRYSSYEPSAPLCTEGMPLDFENNSVYWGDQIRLVAVCTRPGYKISSINYTGKNIINFTVGKNPTQHQTILPSGLDSMISTGVITPVASNITISTKTASVTKVVTSQVKFSNGNGMTISNLKIGGVSKSVGTTYSVTNGTNITGTETSTYGGYSDSNTSTKSFSTKVIRNKSYAVHNSNYFYTPPAPKYMLIMGNRVNESTVIGYNIPDGQTGYWQFFVDGQVAMTVNSVSKYVGVSNTNHTIQTHCGAKETEGSDVYAYAYSIPSFNSSYFNTSMPSTGGASVDVFQEGGFISSRPTSSSHLISSLEPNMSESDRKFFAPAPCVRVKLNQLIKVSVGCYHDGYSGGEKKAYGWCSLYNGGLAGYCGSKNNLGYNQTILDKMPSGYSYHNSQDGIQNSYTKTTEDTTNGGLGDLCGCGNTALWAPNNNSSGAENKTGQSIPQSSCLTATQGAFKVGDYCTTRYVITKNDFLTNMDDIYRVGGQANFGTLYVVNMQYLSTYPTTVTSTIYTPASGAFQKATSI